MYTVKVIFLPLPKLLQDLSHLFMTQQSLQTEFFFPQRLSNTTKESLWGKKSSLHYREQISSFGPSPNIAP